MAGRPARGATPPKRERVESLAGSLDDIAARRERVVDMYQDRVIDKPQRDKRLAKLDAEAEAVRAKMAAGPEVLPEPPAVLIRDLGEAWARLEGRPDERRELLALLVDRIEITGPGDRRWIVTLREYARPGWPGPFEVKPPDRLHRRRGPGGKFRSAGR